MSDDDTGLGAADQAVARLSAVKVTSGVSISVEPTFLDSQSFPELKHFVWAYRVEIKNNREDAVRLRRRYWRIADSAGGVQEVAGEGVVGEQPLIEPGATYTYTSGAPLATPSGLMAGRYEMECARSGEKFWAEVPAFSLDSPHEARLMN